MSDAISSMLVSVNKKLDFVTKKIHQVCQSSNFVSFCLLYIYICKTVCSVIQRESQLEMYRNEKDSFSDEVVSDCVFEFERYALLCSLDAWQ